MRNVLLTGVGGQGTVLAAKVLAQAAQAKGWQVRTAETIGMAQRGGSVVSHVRMGDNGEEVITPLVAKGTADMIIAFERAVRAGASLPCARWRDGERDHVHPAYHGSPFIRAVPCRGDDRLVGGTPQ